MMNDKEYAELKLRAMIVPHQVRWPAPELLHWQKLHAVANEARERVSKFFEMRSIATRAFPAMTNTTNAVRVPMKRLPISRHRKRWRVRARL